jgi:UDP-glucose 4-epimerase
MRVLVTGGAGFIGSHVVDRCIAAGHDVVVVDNLSTGHRQSLPPAARLAIMDIRSPDLADVFRAEQPDAVIHLAAQAEVRRSVENPLLDADVNIMGSVNLLECSRRFGVRQVIYSSSGGAVYGDTAVLPTPEAQPAHPASPYGVS